MIGRTGGPGIALFLLASALAAVPAQAAVPPPCRPVSLPLETALRELKAWPGWKPLAGAELDRPYLRPCLSTGDRALLVTGVVFRRGRSPTRWIGGAVIALDEATGRPVDDREQRARLRLLAQRLRAGPEQVLGKPTIRAFITAFGPFRWARLDEEEEPGRSCFLLSEDAASAPPRVGVRWCGGQACGEHRRSGSGRGEKGRSGSGHGEKGHPGKKHPGKGPPGRGRGAGGRGAQGCGVTAMALRDLRALRLPLLARVAALVGAERPGCTLGGSIDLVRYRKEGRRMWRVSGSLAGPAGRRCRGSWRRGGISAPARAAPGAPVRGGALGPKPAREALRRRARRPAPRRAAPRR